MVYIDAWVAQHLLIHVQFLSIYPSQHYICNTNNNTNMELNLIWLDLILLLVFHHLYAYSSGDLKNKLYLQFKFSDGEKLLTINTLKPRGRNSISIIAWLTLCDVEPWNWTWGPNTWNFLMEKSSVKVDETMFPTLEWYNFHDIQLTQKKNHIFRNNGIKKLYSWHL